jgi:hypothetical protein
VVNTFVTKRSFLRAGYAAVMSSIIAASATAQTGGPFDLSWNTIDGGGASSSGASFMLSGTIAQPDASGALSGGSFSLMGGFWPGVSMAAATLVDIVSANPPPDNPFVTGTQPFRDVLDTGTSSAPSAGIGGAGTQPQGGIQYAPLSVTFSGTPSPAPAPGNITVQCTGGICPSVTSVTGSGAGPYAIALSGVIPPTHCTTLTFAGTVAGEKLQYQSLPGDTNLDGSVNTLDLLALVQAINSGTANLPSNLARYNIDRNSGTMPVNTQDLLRVVQLLNGVNTTQAFNGATVTACP